jgi:hypothetical protein
MTTIDISLLVNVTELGSCHKVLRQRVDVIEQKLNCRRSE